MNRIIGIDYGKVRIGIAHSDPRHIFALPYKTISAGASLQETVKILTKELSHHESIQKIVLGLPLMMNGKDSPISIQVRELAILLEKSTGKTIILWDERLTTAQVEKTLKEMEVSRKKRTLHTDVMAACVLLQSFLDSCIHRPPEG